MANGYNQGVHASVLRKDIKNMIGSAGIRTASDIIAVKSGQQAGKLRWTKTKA